MLDDTQLRKKLLEILGDKQNMSENSSKEYVKDSEMGAQKMREKMLRALRGEDVYQNNLRESLLTKAPTQQPVDENGGTPNLAGQASKDTVTQTRELREKMLRALRGEDVYQNNLRESLITKSPTQQPVDENGGTLRLVGQASKDYSKEYVRDSVMDAQKMREEILRVLREKENNTEASDKSEPLSKRLLEVGQKVKEEADWTLSMYKNDAQKEAFKKEMLDDTAKYIKKYGLDKNQAEEDKWMNDRFRHTYGSAIMGIRGGELGARLGGISHEIRPNNPFDEWKMDVWNNKEGRKIARDLKKEYGQALYEMSDEELKDLIASRVVEKIQKNELISDPSDKRRYWGIPEEGFYWGQNFIYKIIEDHPEVKEKFYTESLKNKSKR